MSLPVTRADREVRVRAPGKVNLSLRVGPRRRDGYHPVSTVFQAVSVYEDVVARPGDGFVVTVSGPQSDRVPTDPSNLALRAAHLLADLARIRILAARGAYDLDPDEQERVRSLGRGARRN